MFGSRLGIPTRPTGETGDSLGEESRVPSTEARDGTGRRKELVQQWAAKLDDGHLSVAGETRYDHGDTERRLMKTVNLRFGGVTRPEVNK